MRDPAVLRFTHMDEPSFNPARRAFLGARPACKTIDVRLPWLATRHFVEECTRCGECLSACPESIIVAAAGGFPSVDFQRGECTFCGACADACPESLFDREAAEPWQLGAVVSESCLARHHIMCRSCEDACPEGAIGFRPALGRAPTPAIDESACTGCGACVAVCPENAISIE